MSDEYVVFYSPPSGQGGRPYAVGYAHPSEVEARAWIISDGDDIPGYTVHKLGPAIEPPEPREWVVVGTDGCGWSRMLTRGQAEEILAEKREGSRGSYRLARLVLEDAS